MTTELEDVVDKINIWTTKLRDLMEQAGYVDTFRMFHTEFEIIINDEVIKVDSVDLVPDIIYCGTIDYDDE